MKIEIGESLALSYLKHVKKCVIYQTNWKSSSQWAFLGGVKDAREAFEKLVKDGLLSFPGKTKPSFSQFLKQAEIDILGINFVEKKMYVMDIAYHEYGLNYKNKDKTIKNLKEEAFYVPICFYAVTSPKTISMKLFLPPLKLDPR